MTKLVQAKKEEAKKAGFTADEYNEVAMNARLVAINMLSTKFDVNAECMGSQHDWNLTYDRRMLSCTFGEEESYVAAIMRYEVVAKAGRKRAMICTADYGIMYSLPEECSEAAANGFCKNVGSYAAYPYFRAHVAALAWNAGLSLPPLPSIASTAHIPKKPKKRLLGDDASEN